MTTIPREKRLDTLRKLKRHAESAKAIGSEEEALAFTAMMQRLLNEYQIDRAELDEADQDAEDLADPIEEVPATGVRVRSCRIDWLERLAECVAFAHFCELLINPRSSQVWFVGRRSKADLACQVYRSLVEGAERIADQAYVQHFYAMKAAGNVRKARGFRPGFLTGFVSRLAARYRKLLDELDQRAARVQGALVLFQDERARAKEFVKNMLADRTPRVARVPSLAPFEGTLDHRPTLRRAFLRGDRWGVLLGTDPPRLESLHPTETGAHAAVAAKGLPPARKGYASPAGVVAGAAAADRLDLGGSQEPKALRPAR